MNIFTKSCVTLTLAVVGILQAQPAQAQFRNQVRPYTGQILQIPSVQQAYPVNTNWTLSAGLNTQQYLYNQSVQAQVFNQYPAWAYGYNPYPSPIYQQNYGTPAYGYGSYPNYPNYPSYFPISQPTWPYYGR